jgi:hypothetical protein
LANLNQVKQVGVVQLQKHASQLASLGGIVSLIEQRSESKSTRVSLRYTDRDELVQIVAENLLLVLRL